MYRIPGEESKSSTGRVIVRRAWWEGAVVVVVCLCVLWWKCLSGLLETPSWPVTSTLL